MKRALLGLAALLAALWAAAVYVPGFWSIIPQGAKDSIPQGLRTALNLPAAQGKPATPPAGGAPGARGPGGGGPGAGGPGGGRPVQVALASAVKKNVPFGVESIGTVQTIASVTIRPRVDSQIDQILFADGAAVKAGDILVKLDARAIEAQIKQAEANLGRDRANLDLARRTLKRGEELADSNFATKQRLDENRSTVAAQEAGLKANEAALDALKTQLTYYTIRAPITGKAGLANLKPGNIAQAAAAATAITTINQVAPIYVSFSLPQRYFQELKDSLARGDGEVAATLQGGSIVAKGKLTLVENAMDNATGTIGVRATFANADEALWPGAIANIKMTLRVEKDVITVPREALQMSQRGSFVFVVKDGVAKMQPVKPGRGVDGDMIILDGLQGGESVVVDGQLLIVDGAKVQGRQGKTSAISGEKPAGAL